MKALSVGVAVAFGAAGLAGAVWWSTVHAQQIPRHEPVKKAQIEGGKRAGVPIEVAEKLKALERENRELRQANEILRKASAYFALAELDRPFRR